jgi:hypothetical protein
MFFQAAFFAIVAKTRATKEIFVARRVRNR